MAIDRAKIALLGDSTVGSTVATSFARGGIVAEPTEAQKAAGNYRKLHTTIHGLRVSIENERGSERSGTGPDGKPWSVKMPVHYGYLKGTKGKDGDHVDVYVGPHLDSRAVHLVDQVDHRTRMFDEHKALVGFKSRKDALDHYHRSFSDGRGPDRVGAVSTIPVEAFRKWLDKGTRRRPYGKVPLAINRQDNVPFLAGASKTKSGLPVNIDNRVPATITVKGKTFPPDKYLAVHELREYELMLKGMKYEAAHRIALRAEKAAVEADGIEWAGYQQIMHRLAEAIEKAPHPHIAKLLYTKPYNHWFGHKIEHEEDEETETPEEVQEARSFAEGGSVDAEGYQEEEAPAQRYTPLADDEVQRMGLNPRGPGGGNQYTPLSDEEVQQMGLNPRGPGADYSVPSEMAKAAAKGVAPGLGGVAAAGVGAGAGAALAGPVGGVVGAVVGGLGGGYAVSQAQEWLLDKLGLNADKDTAAVFEQEHPWLAAGSSIAGSLVGASPQQAGMTLGRRALMGGAMGGIEAAKQAVTGNFDPASIALAAGAGAAFPGTNRIGTPLFEGGQRIGAGIRPQPGRPDQVPLSLPKPPDFTTSAEGETAAYPGGDDQVFGEAAAPRGGTQAERERPVTEINLTRQQPGVYADVAPEAPSRENAASTGTTPEQPYAGGTRPGTAPVENIAPEAQDVTPPKASPEDIAKAKGEATPARNTGSTLGTAHEQAPPPKNPGTVGSNPDAPLSVGSERDYRVTRDSNVHPANSGGDVRPTAEVLDPARANIPADVEAAITGRRANEPTRPTELPITQSGFTGPLHRDIGRRPEDQDAYQQGHKDVRAGIDQEWTGDKRFGYAYDRGANDARRALQEERTGKTREQLEQETKEPSAGGVQPENTIPGAAVTETVTRLDNLGLDKVAQAVRENPQVEPTVRKYLRDLQGEQGSRAQEAFRLMQEGVNKRAQEQPYVPEVQRAQAAAETGATNTLMREKTGQVAQIGEGETRTAATETKARLVKRAADAAQSAFDKFATGKIGGNSPYVPLPQRLRDAIAHAKEENAGVDALSPMPRKRTAAQEWLRQAQQLVGTHDNPKALLPSRAVKFLGDEKMALGGTKGRELRQMNAVESEIASKPQRGGENVGEEASQNWVHELSPEEADFYKGKGLLPEEHAHVNEQARLADNLIRLDHEADQFTGPLHREVPNFPKTQDAYRQGHLDYRAGNMNRKYASGDEQASWDRGLNDAMTASRTARKEEPENWKDIAHQEAEAAAAKTAKLRAAREAAGVKAQRAAGGYSEAEARAMSAPDYKEDRVTRLTGVPGPEDIADFLRNTEASGKLPEDAQSRYNRAIDRALKGARSKIKPEPEPENDAATNAAIDDALRQMWLDRKGNFDTTQFAADFKRGMAKLNDYWVKNFAPEMYSSASRATGNKFASRNAAYYNQRVVNERYSVERLDNARLANGPWLAMEQLKPSERLDWIDRFEQGQQHPEPWMNTVDQFMRDKMDFAKREEEARGILYDYRDNYLSHLFERPDDFQGWLNRFIQTVGPTWFQKEREFDTIRQAVNAGYKLKYDNPMDIMIHRLNASVDATSKMDLLYDLSRVHLAEPIKLAQQGGANRNEWQPILAPDRKQWALAPDIQPLWKNAIDAKGLWEADGPWGNIFRGWMSVKAHWMPIKLGLSGFHMLHIGLITNQADNFARGFTFGAGQNPGFMDRLGAGLQEMGKNALEPLFAFDKGNRFLWVGPQRQSTPLGQTLRTALETPERFRTPDQQFQAKLLENMGLTGGLSPEESIKTFNKAATAAWNRGQYVRWMPLKAGEAVAKLTSPMMQQMIPYLKLASAYRSGAAYLALHPEAVNNMDVHGAALREMGKSIENRYGQMFYRNLFWNKVYEDAGKASMLSLGWNFGFAREAGGGFKQLGTEAIRAGAATAGQPFAPRSGVNRVIADANTKGAYVAAYTTLAMTAAGAMSYALSGQLPNGMDYVFPRAGGQNPDGSPRRITTMFFTREPVMYAKHSQEQNSYIGGALHMLWSKMILSPVVEAMQNRDYFGYQLYDTTAPWYKQWGQLAGSVLKSNLSPIAKTGAEQAQRSGGGARDVALSYAGFGPAPGYISKNAMQNRISHLYYEGPGSGTKPYAQKATDETRRDARADLARARQSGDTKGAADAYQRLQQSGLKAASINQPYGDLDRYQFSRLAPDTQKGLIRDMTPEDFKRYALGQSEVRGPRRVALIQEWNAQHPNQKVGSF